MMRSDSAYLSVQPSKLPMMFGARHNSGISMWSRPLFPLPTCCSCLFFHIGILELWQCWQHSPEACSGSVQLSGLAFHHHYLRVCSDILPPRSSCQGRSMTNFSILCWSLLLLTELACCECLPLMQPPGFQ